MSHLEINAGREWNSAPDQLVDAQLEALQQQIDLLRERLVSAPARPSSADKSILKALVAEILRSRRRREKIFGADLFGEPAWDILLELYAAELTHQNLSVSDACYASAVPHTTALRWIAKLENDGWVTRVYDPCDGRRCWLMLSDQGSDKMRRFVTDLAIRPTENRLPSPGE